MFSIYNVLLPVVLWLVHREVLRRAAETDTSIGRCVLVLPYVSNDSVAQMFAYHFLHFLDSCCTDSLSIFL